MAETKKSNRIQRVPWINIVAIVIAMVLGVLFIIAYAVDSAIIDYIIGSAFLVAGIGGVIFSFVKTGNLLSFGSVLGILAFSTGIFEMVQIGLAEVIASIISWFIFIFGLILFLVGIITLAINPKKNLISGIIYIVFGTILAVLGGLMIFPLGNSVLGESFIWLIAGIAIILISLYALLALFFPQLKGGKIASRKKIED